jgi:hypothetical protein
MESNSNRRQFERLSLSEQAIVVDENGREIGPVKLVGGGGMLVCECQPEALEWLTPGKQMRVTIVEPELGTTNVMDVEVRYLDGNNAGMQFINLK